MNADPDTSPHSRRRLEGDCPYVFDRASRRLQRNVPVRGIPEGSAIAAFHLLGRVESRPQEEDPQGLASLPDGSVDRPARSIFRMGP